MFNRRNIMNRVKSIFRLHVLLILLIGGIGMNTFTSCSMDDGYSSNNSRSSSSRGSSSPSVRSSASTPTADCIDYQYRYSNAKVDVKEWEDRLERNEKSLDNAKEAQQRNPSASGAGVVSSASRLVNTTKEGLRNAQSRMNSIASEARAAGCSVS